MFTPWIIILYSECYYSTIWFPHGSTSRPQIACWPKSDVDWVMRLCGSHFSIYRKRISRKIAFFSFSFVFTANILCELFRSMFVVIWMLKRKPNDCLLSHHCRSTFNIYESNIPWCRFDFTMRYERIGHRQMDATESLQREQQQQQKLDGSNEKLWSKRLLSKLNDSIMTASMESKEQCEKYSANTGWLALLYGICVRQLILLFLFCMKLIKLNSVARWRKPFSLYNILLPNLI